MIVCTFVPKINNVHIITISACNFVSLYSCLLALFYQKQCRYPNDNGMYLPLALQSTVPALTWLLTQCSWLYVADVVATIASDYWLSTQCSWLYVADVVANIASDYWLSTQCSWLHVADVVANIASDYWLLTQCFCQCVIDVVANIACWHLGGRQQASFSRSGRLRFPLGPGNSSFQILSTQ